MQPDDTVQIPLLARDGSIRAYATVDTADAEWASQWTWRLHPKGYASRRVGKDTILLHRALLGLVPGDKRQGDHVDRVRLNDRRLNLRILTKAGNPQNTPSKQGSSSQYRGVSWRPDLQKWEAYVGVDKRKHWLGVFASETDAAAVALAARKRLLPFATD